MAATAEWSFQEDLETLGLSFAHGALGSDSIGCVSIEDLRAMVAKAPEELRRGLQGLLSEQEVQKVFSVIHQVFSVGVRQLVPAVHQLLTEQGGLRVAHIKALEEASSTELKDILDRGEAVLPLAGKIKLRALRDKLHGASLGVGVEMAQRDRTAPEVPAPQAWRYV